MQGLRLKQLLPLQLSYQNHWVFLVEQVFQFLELICFMIPTVVSFHSPTFTSIRQPVFIILPSIIIQIQLFSLLRHEPQLLQQRLQASFCIFLLQVQLFRQQLILPIAFFYSQLRLQPKPQPPSFPVIVVMIHFLFLLFVFILEYHEFASIWY